MKGFAIGCGTIVALFVAGIAWVLLTTDLSPTPEEFAACDEAVAAAGARNPDREGTGYAIQERNGTRTVSIPYAAGAGTAFTCTLVDGTVEGVVRQENVTPGGSEDASDELAI